MDAYLQHLFAVATNPSEEVRKRVCQALVMLLDVQLEKLVPHMNNVVQYMLLATTDANELVALEACEFWSAICETKVAKQARRVYALISHPDQKWARAATAPGATPVERRRSSTSCRSSFQCFSRGWSTRRRTCLRSALRTTTTRGSPTDQRI